MIWLHNENPTIYINQSTPLRKNRKYVISYDKKISQKNTNKKNWNGCRHTHLFFSLKKYSFLYCGIYNDIGDKITSFFLSTVKETIDQFIFPVSVYPLTNIQWNSPKVLPMTP